MSQLGDQTSMCQTSWKAQARPLTMGQVRVRGIWKRMARCEETGQFRLPLQGWEHGMLVGRAAPDVRIVVDVAKTKAGVKVNMSHYHDQPGAVPDRHSRLQTSARHCTALHGTAQRSGGPVDQNVTKSRNRPLFWDNGLQGSTQSRRLNYPRDLAARLR